MTADIGRRVADLLPSGSTQRSIAADVGMTPDAFSRALRGERGFAAIELAKIADLLDADLHFLITGAPDPTRMIAAARHSFDQETRRHHVPGKDIDLPHLDAVLLAYEQVQGELAASVVPETLESARAALGADFVRPFADRLDALGIDVVRLSELTSAYSFRFGDRAIIALKATGNWFWENWSLAHELGHLVHQAESLRRGRSVETVSSEPEANGFAAELLLPSPWIRSIDWTGVTESDIAEHVWDRGVSVDALKKRVAALRLPMNEHLETWSTQPTQRLLRRHWSTSDAGHPITSRMDAASTRRFPLALQDAHLAQISQGTVRKDTLAWMLGVDPVDLEVDEPTDGSALSSDALADLLGLGA
ncbi:XRE family transcriptional regulator [Rathayibacter sp. VKM Ac-2926]|uniref:XRE family transcriptional regulator n=1 Tax=Rathayibacter sp. VKM Ac-2926 TaxID=2929477 RepID=UPI001FB24A6E|nr:XRE family transcriptional regulator [Rathayibacter sp. VKM Ac-2926]MCJ1704401.1 XRE family transcriptional regulator [Rathayibacter sp. VKM Ac-2926]